MKLTSKVFYNSLVQVVGKFLSTFLGLFAIAWFARYLGNTGFGYYAMATAFASVFAIVADLGLTLVASQMLNRPNVDEAKVLGNLFLYRIVSALVIIGITPLAASLMPYSEGVKIGIYLSALAYLFNNLTQIFVSLFQKSLRTDYAAVADVASRLLWVLGAWGTIKYNFGLSGIFWTMAAANILSFLMQWLFARRLAIIKLSFDWLLWKEIMSKSWPLLTTIVLNLIYLKADIVILSLMAAPAVVGLYGAAYKVVDVLVSLPFIFAGLALPILTVLWNSQKQEQFWTAWHKFFDYTSMIVLPLTVGGIMLSKQIMVAVAGDQFALAGPILAILMLAVLMVYFSCVFTHTVISWNKQVKLIWVYLFTALISLPLYYYGIKYYSYYGAAWGTVITETLIVLGTMLVMIKQSELFRFKIWRSLKIILASFIMAGVLYLSLNLFRSVGWWLLLQITIAAGAYLAALLVVKALTYKDIINLIGKYENPIS